jgi:hypothetical protein
MHIRLVNSVVQVNLDSLNNQFFINYLDFLISKVFKILPISEEQPETLRDYLESLIIELKGNQSLISQIKCDANFLSLLGTLQYFVENDCSHRTIKKEVFKCINIIQGLQEKYK